MPVGRWKLYAHRGARLTSPENTLESLARAKAEGADGIEFDVQLSADGEPFLFHDGDARRVCGLGVRVGDMRWKDLRELRVFGRHKVPHLDEALSALEAWPGAELYLDLHQPSVPLAETVARRLESSRARERAFVLDFYKSRRLLLAARAAAPRARLAAMPGPPWLTDASCDLGVSAVSLGWDGTLTRFLYRAACRLYDVRAAVARAKARGVAVSGGLANSPDEVVYFLAQGFDGVWTDDLLMAKKELSRADDH